ncbi:MAG: hypothetical protein CL993_01435 [Euryarchaeota archaeon]|mgnify:FL=1|nr:hypothetical protein [Euryarchaeota archaeon]
MIYLTPESWLALASVFALGAMSPGPSLAIVMRNTISGGRSQGLATGIGHGLGFGIYAFLAALGIATALSLHESVELFLKIGGTILLLWLSYSFLKSASSGTKETNESDEYDNSELTGFLQGFLIALFNPKILAWMLALYAPFIEADLGIETLIGMGILGMSIDTTWYISVATILSSGKTIDKIKSNSHIIDGAMGILMLIFALILNIDIFNF